ncbi:MAG TPA: Mpo1-like protein [Thermoanaerobaculia bacterium]|nr:Mpo1-like protein [Thermoanaerobaculia bacterium]
MKKVATLFDEYAAYHRTAGNKAFHRIGIPLIVLSLLGLLSHLEIARFGDVRIDAAVLLIVLAEVWYLMLEWRLATIMGVIVVVFYAVSLFLPLWLLWSLFVLGWILQFIGHSVYEKRQPAFATNLVHLLVGPLWIVDDLIRIVASSSASKV